MAAAIGQPFMPWQQQVADVGLELREDGRPAYRDVTITVPRQSGKTTLVLAWEVQRAVGWAHILGAPQRVAYSAQTGKDAATKLLEDQVPLLERVRSTIGLGQVVRKNGSEAVRFRNGSRITLLESSTKSGHGGIVDLGVKDELFADTDMRRDQALNPAMATREHAQSLTTSTQGTADSVALNLAVDAGRAAVEFDVESGTAYFEWSAAPADDPGDPATWWRCMPALGRTISLEVVEHAYRTLTLDEFKRAYLNVPTKTKEQVIPPGKWAAVCDVDVEATAGVFALEVNPERTCAAIVTCGDGPIVEVIDYRPGVGWLVDRVVELHGRYGGAFAVDKNGPAATFVAELERRGVHVVEIDSRGLTRASGGFYDVVMSGDVRIRQNADLDAAVQGAAKRPVGDAWAWARKSSSLDVSLLVAASLALWAFENGLGQAKTAGYLVL